MEGLRDWNQNEHWGGDELNFGWNFQIHHINLDLTHYLACGAQFGCDLFDVHWILLFNYKK